MLQAVSHEYTTRDIDAMVQKKHGEDLCVGVCVCMRERERERVCMCVCVCRGVCLCVCASECICVLYFSSHPSSISSSPPPLSSLTNFHVSCCCLYCAFSITDTISSLLISPLIRSYHLHSFSLLSFPLLLTLILSYFLLPSAIISVTISPFSSHLHMSLHSSFVNRV